MLISIPMAIYNGEKFLDRAISSFIAQSNENWELICVDDGSTDGSARVVAKYAERDHRISLIRQANHGGPTARMNAYRRAKGDFVFIGVDQDDYIEKEFIENLISDVKVSKAEFILCDWLLEQPKGDFISHFAMHGRRIGETMSGLDAFTATFPWSIHLVGLWSKRLVEQIAIDAENAFNKYDADEFLARKIALHVDEVYLGRAKYFHCRNPDSITTKISLRRLASLGTNERLLALAESHKLPDETCRKIIIRQRNDLAFYFSIAREVLNGADAKTTKETIKFIGKAFKQFKRDLRRFSRKTIMDALKAEIVIIKLVVRYARMRLREVIKK